MCVVQRSQAINSILTLTWRNVVKLNENFLKLNVRFPPSSTSSTGPKLNN